MKTVDWEENHKNVILSTQRVHALSENEELKTKTKLAIFISK